MALPPLIARPLMAADERRSTAVDQLLDRIIDRERQVIQLLAERTPFVETYIQENSPGESANVRDHYFLGRMGVVDAGGYVSFVRRSSAPQPKPVEAKAKPRFLFLKRGGSTAGGPESVTYMPEGFAQMALIDTRAFDRKTYSFEYVRREFLGEVRCLVFDVSPLSKKPGRFTGRIWVEDQDSFIVRVNGTYAQKNTEDLYFHFDSWRVNPLPGVWVPAVVYIEDSVNLTDGAGAADGPRIRLKAQTRIWSYNSATQNRIDELTSVLIESAREVKDTNEPGQISPIESQRRWEGEAEINVIERLEKIGLVAPAGEVDKVLNTVLANLIATNSLDLDAYCRLLLTTPLETFTIGHTIVISRGLVDVLPDESSLALVLATELAHIALAHPTRTEYAFNDRTMVGDEAVLEGFRFARTPDEVASASTKAIALLAHSPYADKLSGAGLFLKAMAAGASRFPRLIQATFGNDLTRYLEMPEFQELLSKAPPLEEARLEQIAALPLGSRIRLEPWSGQTFLMKNKPVSLLSTREKMPFEISPVNIFLTRSRVAAPVETK